MTMTEIKQKLMTIGIGVLAAASAMGQAKPDLIVRGATVIGDPSGMFVEKVSVVVENACSEARAGQSYLLLTFKTGPERDAKSIYYLGNAVKALAGGESQAQTFDVAAKKIGLGRHILIEADPYRNVAEASEENNWRTLFPDGAGVALNYRQCKTGH